nr:uncharacterized protein LOC122271327 [Parasteatoda tepidariorum]
MEMNAASILWQRSIAECKFRYTVLLSDGDSKMFALLSKQNVYGDIPIVKEECINHIAKRLGTALRNKVKEYKARGECLGGKKKGHLTDITINRLANYYRKAIEDNAPNFDKMKNAIFASLYHCTSTDKSPKHMKCPEGSESWCFFNRAKAESRKPPSHKNMKTTLKEDIVAKILPVYQRLSCNELLQRCTSGKTQNANESLHSVIWQQCSKDVFVTKKRLEMATTNAVSQFNMGSVSTVVAKNKEHVSVDIAIKEDNRRIKQSSRRNSLDYKQRIKNKKFIKKNKENKCKKAEGVTYCAGAFDIK